jgi:hypothetical protein
MKRDCHILKDAGPNSRSVKLFGERRGTQSHYFFESLRIPPAGAAPPPPVSNVSV